MVKTNIAVTLRPFEVPNMAEEHVPAAKAPNVCPPTPSPGPAYWAEPEITSRPFNLSEIDEETLLKMCDDFKTEVFKRAGKLRYLDALAAGE